MSGIALPSDLEHNSPLLNAECYLGSSCTLCITWQPSTLFLMLFPESFWPNYCSMVVFTLVCDFDFMLFEELISICVVLTVCAYALVQLCPTRGPVKGLVQPSLGFSWY